jgi:hypothetical protein
MYPKIKANDACNVVLAFGRAVITVFCDVDFVLYAQNRHHLFLGMWVVIVKSYCFCDDVKSLLGTVMRKVY